MNKTIILILTILITSASYAQRFDGLIVFGMTATQVDGDGMGSYNKIGGTLGLFVTHRITDKIEFQTGLDYTGKGARNGFDSYYFFKTQLDYIQIPVQFSYKVFEKIGLTGGLRFGYLMNAYNISGGLRTDENQLEMLNFEPSAYASLDYYIFGKIVLNFGFSYSVFPVKMGGSTWWFNNMLTVTGTYRFSNAKD